MHEIDLRDVYLRPFQTLDEDWAILVGGRDKPNPMTVSWGGFGTLWNRPVVTVYVRPTRHTYGLLNSHPEFTLNFLPEAHHAALEVCGKLSGRDTDKWAAAKLTREASLCVGVPRVAEARLSFECKVLAQFDFDPTRFGDPAILGLYPQKDFHRAYVGHVVKALVA
ncbi:MAG TPA: flavin reductase family protein [Myxococcales bacterium]|jgi:flavin reductase (DIM6/NTAB) family NADH-FMN oxidoreductase RutF